jgi:hypothetical protein
MEPDPPFNLPILKFSGNSGFHQGRNEVTVHEVMMVNRVSLPVGEKKPEVPCSPKAGPSDMLESRKKEEEDSDEKHAVQ